MNIRTTCYQTTNKYHNNHLFILKDDLRAGMWQTTITKVNNCCNNISTIQKSSYYTNKEKIVFRFASSFESILKPHNYTKQTDRRTERQIEQPTDSHAYNLTMGQELIL